ncbi:MAG: glycosyltransferase family 61 protein [Chloroflexota bacterium]
MSFKRPLTFVTNLQPLAQGRGWNYQVHLPGERHIITPSYALPEDLAALLLHGTTFLQDHHLSHAEPLEAIADYYYGRLYGVSEEVLLPAFSCEITDVTLVGTVGAVVTSDNELLTESTNYSSFPQLKMEAALYSSARGEDAPDGQYLSLLSYGAEVYGHWLVDSLPRLMLDFPLDPAIRVIIPRESKDYHYETLALLGIPRERIFEAGRRTIRVQQLHVRSGGTGVVRPHPRLLQRLVAELRAAAGVKETVHQRRLYVSRANMRRRIVNEDALLPILKDYGFEIVRAETLSQVETIRLFSQAAVVAGAFGSPTLNAVYAKPGAVVLEIFNRARWEMQQERLVTLLGHRHWHCFADNLNAEWDTYLDPKKFERCLAYALNG